MNNPTSFGEYFRLFITAVPADLQSDEASQFKKTILRFPEEGVYIYSFTKGRMLYADGWEEVLGYKDDEIDMFKVVEATAPEFLPFSNELNDKTLLFIQSRTRDLEKYSYSIETKKKYIRMGR